MIPEVKAAWLAALRSGEYRQGRASLRMKSLPVETAKDGYDGPRHCCLGVLCDLHSKATGTAWERPDCFDAAYCGTTGTLPGVVRLWAGLESSDPWLPSLVHRLSDGTEAAHSCAGANDNGLDFATIADAIERDL